MPWRIGFLATLLVWLLTAGAAGAAIHRYTDSRGTIHISSGPPPQAAPPTSSFAGESAPDLVRPPEPSPAAADQPAVASATPPVAEPSPAAAKPADGGEKSRQSPDATGHLGPEPLPAATAPATPVINGMMAAAACAAAKAASLSGGSGVGEVALECAANAEPDPRQPAAFAAAAAEPDPALMPPPDPPQAAASTTAGVRRFRDARGVWHVTNAAPADNATVPALAQAAAPSGPGGPALEKAPARTAPEVRASTPQKVAWTSPHPEAATLPTAAQPSPPRASNLILRYRDSKGVIHISNVAPEPVEVVPAPRRPALNPVEAQAPWVLKPVAWSGDAGQSPLKLRKTAVSEREAIHTEGGIKRWRDQKGVWHIETVEYPLPPGVVLPPRLGGPDSGRQAAVSPVLYTPPGAPTRPPPLPSQSPARVPTVTAFKDGRGRLRITNDAPASPGMPPAAGTAAAPAELEPLIAEAAQFYRLPATLVRAVIKTESNFCSWAVSPKGAMGLMQLMPGTAAFLGVTEPFNPRENLHGGCRYLRLLVDCFGGNVPLALAAYNAGYQRVVDCGFQVPAIKETQDFVTQVMGRYVAEEVRAGRPWT